MLALALPEGSRGAQRPRLKAETNPGGVPHLEHVIVVIMENHSFDEAGRQPYLKKFAAAGVTFTQSFAVTHPSQPNYLALWAASTFGSHDDVCPMPGSPLPADNLGHACEKAGISWRAYSENLPHAGDRTCEADGRFYRRKHNPWTNFSNLDSLNERPFQDLEVDAAAGRFPRLAFVIPNQCDNGHDSCSVSPMVASDAWLASHMPRLLEIAGRRGVVILTWDEDDYSQVNQILTVFAGGAVKGGSSQSTHITHYTVCRAICDALGIPPMHEAVKETPITGIWAAGAPPKARHSH